MQFPDLGSNETETDRLCTDHEPVPKIPTKCSTRMAKPWRATSPPNGAKGKARVIRQKKTASRTGTVISSSDGNPMAQMLQQTLSTNPIADFELQLNEPVSREDLARLYGLDLEKLDKLREDEAEDAEARAASRELDVLAGI